MKKSTKPSDTAGRPLSPKQAAFCREYIVDLNATKAAIRAGYSPQTARSQAQRLLTKPDIQTEISRGMEERAERVRIDADTVLRELTRVALTDIGDAFAEDGSLKKIHEMPVEIRRAIAGVDVFEEFEGRGEDRAQIGTTRKIRLNDKLRALELLGKHLRLFSDKIEVTGKNGGPVVVASAENQAALQTAEELCALLATIRESVSDPRERARLLETLPPETSEMAAKMEEAARIAATVEPPASFRGVEFDA